ncbi:MAG: hypothetical protein KF859_10090 [Phycisphaeraceae bacterium]|nr:hypothetical protein [Phycisphaeraceae bacterium]
MSVALLGYVNFLPYLCRLWRGLDWVAQYLPDQGYFISGLLFFGAFASLPAIPLIATYLSRGRIPATFVLSFVVATGLLSFAHHNYDLGSDAQAALGLVFFPIYVTVITGFIAAVSGGIELLIRKTIASQRSRSVRR